MDIQKVLPKINHDPYNYAKSITIKKLVDILRELSHYYYNTDTPLVEDEIYDILIDVVRERSPKNKFLKEVGSISKDMVELPYFMPSLDKIKPNTDTLKKWIQKFKGPYVLSDKLDGISGLYVKDGNVHKLYTRGNIDEGQDISHLIKYVVPKNLKLPKKIAIRGELIVSKTNFKKIKKNYKNARNAVAGLVNAKRYNIHVAKVTDFIGYAVLHPKRKILDQMKLMESYNFPTVKYKLARKLTNEILSNYFEQRREISKYEIDGTVVGDNSKIYSNVNRNPKYAFAFKKVLKDQIAEVIVLDVIWTPSKDGLIKPRIKITPVELLGSTITYATAFNAKFIVDNKLGPGAVIRIVKSGDVIPYIQKVLKPSSSGKPKVPNIDYKWNETKVDFVVKDIFGAAKDIIILKRLLHFFRTLKVKNLSEGILKKMIDHGYKNIFSIVGADPEDFIDIDGLGKKIMNKIFKNMINAFSDTDLETLMAASNIIGRGLGRRKLKLIIKAYPDIMNVKWSEKTWISKVILVEGFDVKTATLFAKNFKKFKIFFHKLNKLIDLDYLLDPVEEELDGDLFENEKVVMTGFRDKKLQEFIENNGGKVTSTVSGNTTILIHDPNKPKGAKYKKAVKLNIKIMTIDEIKNRYKY